MRKITRYQRSSHFCPQATITEIQVQMMDNHEKHPPVLPAS